MIRSPTQPILPEKGRPIISVTLPPDTTAGKKHIDAKEKLPTNKTLLPDFDRKAKK